MGLEEADIADVVVTDIYSSEHNGVTHVYLQQRHNGIGVAGATMTVNITADGRVAQIGHRFLSGLSARVVKEAPLLAPADAAAAARALSLAGAVGRGDEQPVLMYLPLPDGRLTPAWNVTVDEAGAGDFTGSVIVDAIRGQILERRSWVYELVPVPVESSGESAHAEPSIGQSVLNPDSYQVFAAPKESPDDGPRTVEANPSLAGGLASPFGWHDTNGVTGADFTVTRGNNVHVYTDVDGNNVPDPGGAPDGGTGLNFVFPLDLSAAPSAYRPAAVTNAFYWVNWLHDLLWRHGFSEPAGSFQTNNYGRGGTGNDAPLVEVQDLGRPNNASFSLGPDGIAPRVQIGVFSGPNPDRDGALDSGVLANLYFYGAAGRLVGGPANGNGLNSQESSGIHQGLADWFGLVATAVPSETAATPRGVGAYLLGQPPAGGGFRSRPYCTDFAVNELTYADIPGMFTHEVGTVLATVLWQFYWEMVAAHGFNPDLHGDWPTGGNTLALQLVVDALKLVPANPGFVDVRNATLAADVMLTGGANRCAIWRAFAARGLGQGANQGSSNSVDDGAAAFDPPAECLLDVEDPSTRVTRVEPSLRAHPNPFLSQTTISFALAAPGRATVEIFDAQGRIQRRIEADQRAAGRHQLAWDGRGQDGQRLEPGEYLVRLVVNGVQAATRKTMLLR